MYKYIETFSPMRVTGLEPARRGHQNLNLARLPIPPHPPMWLFSQPRLIIYNPSKLCQEAIMLIRR